MLKLFFAFVISGFLLPAACFGGLHFCNKTKYTIWVAIAWESEWFDDHSEGWWELAPGKCKTPIGGDLNESERSYLFWAFSNVPVGGQSTATKMIEWGNDIIPNFCVEPGQFNYGDDKARKCRADMMERFKVLKIGSRKDFTMDIGP